MTTTAFEIRLAEPKDYEEMSEIFRRSIRETASQHYDPRQVAAWSAHADDKEIWAQRVRERMNFLAVEGGRVLGFVQYELPDHVDMTYVHPDCQRRGVATALLYELEKEAKRRGVKTLHVEASITARPFFERCGYQLIAPQIVRVRGQNFRNYSMRKTIA